jgi:spermidine synthase
MDNIIFNDDRDNLYNIIKKSIPNAESNSEKYALKIITGDARNSIKSLNDNYFDAVFHDPYSPSKNPEMWTVDFFKVLHNKMKKNAVLTTYSSALQIRMALIEAGFNIWAGPSVGKKKEGTLATPGNSIHKLNDETINEIKSNVKSTPYSDHDLYDTREVILQRRIDEMKKKRSGIL